MEALLLIDIQKDFLPGGSLAVENGDEIIPVVNNLQENFELVIATRDWHPENHGSFASNHQGKSPGDKVDLEGEKGYQKTLDELSEMGVQVISSKEI
jgi:nicotinamidase/pyrazinamidase